MLSMAKRENTEVLEFLQSHSFFHRPHYELMRKHGGKRPKKSFFGAFLGKR